jgi:hypothetical protein
MHKRLFFTILLQTAGETGLCDSVDALSLRNSSVGHVTALNLPCSIGNFKRRAFVPQMSNMAEITAVLSIA